VSDAHPSSATFPANVATALGDATLRGALARATDLFGERRAAAIGAVPEWEALREQARAVKAHTLANLERYLEEFVARSEAAGVRVHWARDAKEACALVADIAQRGGARRLVKSKSMTTEEIGLNAALARAGCEPVETDLGEWIIQLAGEAPSHIIVPAIHKTKAQIAELFVDKLAIEPSDDVEVLTATARRILRQHFAQADLGISGVNFGVAETGTILILENEGNARLTTSLPRVHVAVMGIEKVIPRFADLEVFLRLLPRSGTGQHLTSYQSLLTGPEPPGEGPPSGADERGRDGPRELHLVLLDNGRAELLKEAVTRQTLACIRCGACLNACPVYRAIGGHAYGSVYPGPIGAILTPQLFGAQKSRHLPFASSLCGACRDVCPVKIDIPNVLLELRARLQTGAAIGGEVPARKAGARERLGWRLWAWSSCGPRRFALAAGLARAAQRLGLLRFAPPLRAWAKDARRARARAALVPRAVEGARAMSDARTEILARVRRALDFERAREPVALPAVPVAGRGRAGRAPRALPGGAGEGRRARRASGEPRRGARARAPARRRARPRPRRALRRRRARAAPRRVERGDARRPGRAAGRAPGRGARRHLRPVGHRRDRHAGARVGGRAPPARVALAADPRGAAPGRADPGHARRGAGRGARSHRRAGIAYDHLRHRSLAHGRHRAHAGRRRAWAARAPRPDPRLNPPP
jgi:L-lactate dehydrogenase complex protein LldF